MKKELLQAGAVIATAAALGGVATRGGNEGDPTNISPVQATQIASDPNKQLFDLGKASTLVEHYDVEKDILTDTTQEGSGEKDHSQKLETAKESLTLRETQKPDREGKSLADQAAAAEGRRLIDEGQRAVDEDNRALGDAINSDAKHHNPQP